MAARVQPSPLELARDHLAGQVRLREDAAKQLDRAASKRAVAERALGTSQQAHAKALTASAEHPESEKLLAAISPASDRLARDRMVLEAAVKAHETARQAFDAFAAHAEKAARDVERVTIESDLSDPRRLAKQEGHGRQLVALVIAMREELRALAASVGEDNLLVRRLGELGGVAPASDGLPAGVGVARALLERGLDVGGRSNELRWALNPNPKPGIYGPGPSPLVQLATLIDEALARPASVNGASALARAVDAWAGFRSATESDRVRAAAEEAAQHRHPPVHPEEHARLESLGPNIFPHGRGIGGPGRVVGADAVGPLGPRLVGKQ
jgi:hypothetical protein